MLAKVINQLNGQKRAMNIFEGAKLTGVFFSIEGKEVPGELNFLGKQTSLILRHSEPFNFGYCIHGILYGQDNIFRQKVTLIHCTKILFSSNPIKGHEFFSQNIFFHYAIIGNDHIKHDEKSITQIRFLINDSSILFYAVNAFGTLLAPIESIEEFIRLHTKNLDREVVIGSDPQLLYFSGKHEIFSTDTILGTISAWHRPNFNFGGPEGVCIRNTIFIDITFKEVIFFDESINSIDIVIQFFEMLIGRPQNINEIELIIESKNDIPKIINVYPTMWPQYGASNYERKSSPSEILINPILDSEKFSSILINWLDKNSTWCDARSRFFTSFRDGNTYGIDRLIRSANMFDIIPSSAFSDKLNLPEELKSAKDECSAIFKKLPSSPERDSVLSTLGRIGKMSLKNKVRQRLNIILNVVSSNFPDLIKVTDEAVNCRNYYVHGSESKIDYNKHFNIILPFLINTLEFVFAASELVEAGWDIKSWCQKETIMFHPFNQYRINYRNNLEKLNFLLSSNQKNKA
ncbi:MAG: HEPN domain-containing protein [Snowella sp.]|nr:HEPN domain-containing protein [Snowella sp.]